MATTFYWETYLEADLAQALGKFYKLALKAFPHLTYTAPHVKKARKKAKASFLTKGYQN